MEESAELYSLLNEQRELATDPNSGDGVRRDAWQVIDQLLDQLIELQEVQHE